MVLHNDPGGLADSICKKATEGCPVRTDAEQAYVVEASELMAKCPSKYGDSAATQKIDTTIPNR